MKEPRLIHYSSDPLLLVYSRDQENRERAMKPNGLWVSSEGTDDWPSWCRENDFAASRLACATQVILGAGANILRIASAEQLDAFNQKYQSPQSRFITLVDWRRVASHYQGIIIAPYIWDRRLYGLTRWYYVWDCASGCIWDTAAIEELRWIVS